MVTQQYIHKNINNLNMPVVNIPKLARNKYNCVIGMDGAKYVTQSQLQTKVPNSGGGGVNHNINTNSAQMSPQLRGMIDESTSYTKDLCYAYTASEVEYSKNLCYTYTAVEVKATQDACYAYTYSKIGSTLTQADVDTIVRSIINDMKASYELVGTSYVSDSCTRIQTSCYQYTDSKIGVEAHNP